MSGNFRAFKLILLIILVTLLICGPAQAGSMKIGSRVEGISLPTVDGTRVDLSQVIGKMPVLIWICDMGPVSVSGVDNILSIYRDFPRDRLAVYVIGTAGVRRADEFVRENQFPIPVLIGGRDSLTAKLTGDSPVTSPIVNLFLIDRNGILQFKGFLPGIRTRAIEAEIMKVL